MIKYGNQKIKIIKAIFSSNEEKLVIDLVIRDSSTLIIADKYNVN